MSSSESPVTTNPAPAPRPIYPGVFAPLPTFFLPGSQDLDIPTFQKHALKVAHAGVGLLVAGSMGEAHHLEPSERVELIKAARTALDTATPSLAHVPIIAGTGAGSTRQTIALTKDAYAAGADYAIVIMSGFFAGALARDRPALKAYWADVAKTSPLPLFIYNYPGAAGGIDLESDLIEELAAENPNIVGVKLTCGNVGKLTRIAATTTDPAWAKAHPRSIDSPFLVLGGFTDFIVPSTYAGAHGAITGLANVAPYSIKALTDLTFASSPISQSYPAPSAPSSLSAVEQLREAQRLQGVIAHGDRTIALTGIAGTKWLLQKVDPETFPIGSEVPRAPLQRSTDADGEKLFAHPDTVALLVEEEKAKAAATVHVKEAVEEAVAPLVNGHVEEEEEPLVNGHVKEKLLAEEEEEVVAAEEPTPTVEEPEEAVEATPDSVPVTTHTIHGEDEPLPSKSTTATSSISDPISGLVGTIQDTLGAAVHPIAA